MTDSPGGNVPGRKDHPMRVLFIGGSGHISPACVDLCIARGYETYVMNRGGSEINPAARRLVADCTDPAAVAAALGSLEFDAVVDFRVFTAADVRQRVSCFGGRTGQYFYISSATVYRKPCSGLRFTESSELGNPLSAYAVKKLEAERELLEAVDRGFPGVIIRPSLTYGDRFVLTSLCGKTPYALIDRMRRGKPVVVNGDGNSLWTITHNTDFAKGLVGLFGNAKAVGEAFHITTDEVLDWNRIYSTLARAAGVEPKLVHVATDTICRLYPELTGGLAGDHSLSAAFDNSKIKSFVPDFVCTVPFAEGARRAVAWLDADPAARHVPDPTFDARMDALAALA